MLPRVKKEAFFQKEKKNYKSRKQISEVFLFQLESSKTHKIYEKLRLLPFSPTPVSSLQCFLSVFCLRYLNPLMCFSLLRHPGILKPFVPNVFTPSIQLWKSYSQNVIMKIEKAGTSFFFLEVDSRLSSWLAFNGLKVGWKLFEKAFLNPNNAWR